LINIFAFLFPKDVLFMVYSNENQVIHPQKWLIQTTVFFQEKRPMGQKKTDLFNPVLKDRRLKVEPPKDPSNDMDTIQPENEGTDNHQKDDMHSFRQAMAGVTPLPVMERKTVPKRKINTTPAHPAPDDELTGITHLQNLVKGSIEMDITFSDEYIEGSVPGISRKILKKMKKGQIPVQDYLDLHGLTKQAAEKAVRNFLVKSHRLGYRCVLIVHGRGRNSPDQFPVLKEMLPKWLNRGPARKLVLAFATSRPYDGGTGAIYVLLRRR
jgi:DNA-nicking Smr family endonuclease